MRCRVAAPRPPKSLATPLQELAAISHSYVSCQTTAAAITIWFYFGNNSTRELVSMRSGANKMNYRMLPSMLLGKKRHKVWFNFRASLHHDVWIKFTLLWMGILLAFKSCRGAAAGVHMHHGLVQENHHRHPHPAQIQPSPTTCMRVLLKPSGDCAALAPCSWSRRVKPVNK